MTNEVERVVMRLEDIRPHMKITYGFTRYHVTEAIVRMVGGIRRGHDEAASRILAKARKDGLIRFSNGMSRSVYYEFTDA